MTMIRFFIFILFFSTLAYAQSILIIGDSITEGFGVAKDSAYPKQLDLLLQKKHPNINVINAGSSGSTSASALSRLKWHIKSKPQILLLALGANDGLRGFKPQATKENLSKTIQVAKENGIKVILVGMKMPLNYGKDYRNAFEKVYQDLVKEHKVTFIPFLLEGVGGIKEFNLSDGIHPNEKGHKIIAKHLIPIIEKAL